MPNPLICAALILSTQGEFKPLPEITFKPAITPGQREVALGPELQGDVTMEVRQETEVQTEFTPNKVLGPALMESAVGYVRWSVSDGTLFDKPCRVLKTDGITKGTIYTKRKQLAYYSQNTSSYWITAEGKLLRQSVHKFEQGETKSAECVYWPDHIEVSVVDGKERKSFTVYPKIDLSLVDLQFKPMIKDNKVVLPYKEYYVFDPFSGAFDKYKATVGGSFHGTWLATKFEGLHVDIQGPKDKVIAYVSKEGDLIKVDLPQNIFLVLDNLPHSKDPMYQKTVGKGGG